MGSLFGGGKQKSSTTQNQSWGPTGYISDAYKGLVGQAQQTAQTPWNSATQQNVAGFTAPQQQGFSTVQQTVGDYQPYLSDAGALADRGSAAITGADISNYMNPYTDQVIGSAINDWDLMSDRRMADVNSNASKMGALTGDRSQVAQALAREASDREMSSGIASLRNQGWQSALGAAQTDASRALQGSQIQSGLGSLAQQLGFNDANALLGIGGMQQDQKQKVLDANTANAKAQSAYPFETQQWLASILQGVGSQAGGTSTGTGSSTSKTSGGGLGKLIGLGATLFGMPGMADGGVVTGEPQNTSYVPISNMRPTASMQPPQMSVPAASSGGSSGMGEMLEGLKMAKEAIGGTGGLGAMMRTTTDPSSGWSTTVNPSSASGWGNYLSSGLGGLASGIGSAFGFADGGVVEEQPSGLGAIRPTASASPPAEKGWGSMWGNGLSDDANQAIFLSGLGMIAGGGRDAFEDIGRGGLAGANFYAQAQRQRKADAEAKAKEAQGKMMEINGRVIRLMPDGTTSVVYDAPAAPAAPPPGFARQSDGTMAFIPGGPADPATIEAQSKARGANGSKKSLEEVAIEREALADKLGLDGDIRKHFIATGQMPRTAPPQEMREYQTKDAMWAERLLRAEKSIDDVAGVDAKTGKPLEGKYNPARNANAWWPDDMYGANLVNSKEWQSYKQAAREGIAAILRKDTGAAVTETEFEMYFQQYYPQPGDDPTVVLQKKKAREAISGAMRASSGPAFDKMFPGYGGAAPSGAPTDQPQANDGSTAEKPDPLGIRKP